MDSILRALADPALLAIVALSFRVTGLALVIADLTGVPLGAVVGLTRFPGKRLVTLVFYTGMGLPPVVVGLFVYMMLSRGPVRLAGLAVHAAGDGRRADDHRVPAGRRA